ncbi:putative nuclease HARBI1 [Frankliniella occidentalis]|uniref:Nuclease HARBI1 n=1 Tax=Frankliniella occidentalis TaxID=133901 RepID=A0A9C6X886_FRAOC|nr:putative nuclease HARBI1 [Frankliniella occidentalis]
MIRNLPDPEFKEHFRMDRATFEILVHAVAHERLRTGKLQRNRTDVGESTAMGLWVLFNKDTFRSIGLNYENDRKHIHNQYTILLNALCGIGHKYIKWPNIRQRQQTELFYRRNFGFPGVAGVIDGTLIRITAPSEQKQRYVDKNHDYSINVMIVCNHKRVINDIFIGQPGSVHDSRVFRRSPLAHALYSRNDLLGPNQHLIGDGGYMCTEKMLVPYRNDGNVDQSHRTYNFKLSQCRATIERTNSLFKSRMARTEKLFCKNIVRTNKHIAASAVLHNFILLRGEEQDGIVLEGELPEINVHDAIVAGQEEGYRRRQQIRLQLAEEYE